MTLGSTVTLTPPTPIEIAVVVLAIPLAQVLHELTHFAVAWLLRAAPVLRVSVHSPMYVAYDPPSERVDRAVKLAPLTAGVGGLSAGVWAFGWPDGSWLTLAGALAWYAYTFTLNPFSRRAEDWRALGIDPTGVEGWRREVIKAGFVLLGAVAIQSSPYAANPYVYHFVVKPLVLGGVALFVLALYDGLRTEEAPAGL